MVQHTVIVNSKMRFYFSTLNNYTVLQNTVMILKAEVPTSMVHLTQPNRVQRAVQFIEVQYGELQGPQCRKLHLSAMHYTYVYTIHCTLYTVLYSVQLVGVPCRYNLMVFLVASVRLVFVAGLQVSRLYCLAGWRRKGVR